MEVGADNKKKIIRLVIDLDYMKLVWEIIKLGYLGPKPP